MKLYYQIEEDASSTGGWRKAIPFVNRKKETYFLCLTVRTMIRFRNSCRHDFWNSLQLTCMRYKVQPIKLLLYKYFFMLDSANKKLPIKINISFSLSMFPVNEKALKPWNILHFGPWNQNLHGTNFVKRAMSVCLSLFG